MNDRYEDTPENVQYMIDVTQGSIDDLREKSQEQELTDGETQTLRGLTLERDRLYSLLHEITEEE